MLEHFKFLFLSYLSKNVSAFKVRGFSKNFLDLLENIRYCLY